MLRPHAALVLFASLLAGCASSRSGTPPDAQTPSPGVRGGAAALPVCPGVESGRFAVLPLTGASERETRQRMERAGVPADALVLDPESAGIRLVNPHEIMRLSSTLTPTDLRPGPSATGPGLYGLTMVALRIDENGMVSHVEVDHSSGLSQVDNAALREVRQMRFTPAQFQGCRIPVLTWFPVSFSVSRQTAPNDQLPPG